MTDITLCQFLLFSTFAAAQSRSKQLATGMHCDGVNTVYWHAQVALTDGTACMIIDPAQGSAYGTKPGDTALAQLTPSEIASLQPWSAVQNIWPSGPPH